VLIISRENLINEEREKRKKRIDILTLQFGSNWSKKGEKIENILSNMQFIIEKAKKYITLFLEK